MATTTLFEVISTTGNTFFSILYPILPTGIGILLFPIMIRMIYTLVKGDTFIDNEEVEPEQTKAHTYEVDRSIKYNFQDNMFTFGFSVTYISFIVLIGYLIYIIL